MSGQPPTTPHDDPSASSHTSYSASGSATPTPLWPEHHLPSSASYFPPTSPVVRPISPTAPSASRRMHSSRFTRSASTASARRPPPHRSASVASSNMNSRPHRSEMFSEEDEDDHHRNSSDEEEPIAGTSRGRDASRARESMIAPVDAQDSDEADARREREFTEDDPITLKERQSLINVQHPFGLPIWKPALYKKSRTVTRNAETDLHAQPSAIIESHYLPGNILWTLLFGWWLAAVFVLLAGVLWLLPFGGRQYAQLVYGLGWYIFWPFGKYVQGDEPEPKEKGVDSSDPGATPENDPDLHREITGSGSSTSGGTIRRIDSTISAVMDHLGPNVSLRPASWESPTQAQESNPLLVDVTSPPPGKSYGSIPLSTQGPVQAVEDAKRHYLGTICYWLALITIIAPLMLFVCLICWAMVITIPMAKLNWALVKHLFSRPDKIRFCAGPTGLALQIQGRQNGSSDSPIDEGNAFAGPSESTFTLKGTPRLEAGQSAPHGSPRSKVLLCTYRAVGLQYYKYTVGGVNILFINLLPIVFFAIIDGFIILPYVDNLQKHHQHVPRLLAFVASRALIFTISLASVIPLSYFIGMAVASISAQSSIGMGAVINATFGSIIEIILYSVALTRGKGLLVEGSIVGSLLAGVLLMPGASMCSGAWKKKEQKFNAKSAGVTSTMLIMAIIGVLTPTLFYQTYGNFELICKGCPAGGPAGFPGSSHSWKCKHCYYEHPNPVNDPFYQETVKQLMYFCAIILLLSYLIGLWFSLRTHASQIWQNPQQLMNPLDLSHIHGPAGTGSGRMSVYNRIVASHLAQSIPQHTTKLLRKASNLTLTGSISGRGQNSGGVYGGLQTPGFLPSGPPSPAVPRRISYAPASHPNHQPTTSSTSAATQTQPSNQLITHPAGYGGHDGSGGAPKETGVTAYHLTPDELSRAIADTVSALRHEGVAAAHGGHGGADHGGESGGHDAPSWSRFTSASVLLACTALYAAIAEILVDVVDVVLEGSGIDEKFLGITLFALVPNTTEFMNAMSFALNGNIALSMEIGSAYALQVCLLQIPAMVAFSAWYDPRSMGTISDTFTLIFPRWDVIAIILSIFLLTYTYIEAKSNYHRGSILILSYVVLTAGFYYAPDKREEDTLQKWALDSVDLATVPVFSVLQSAHNQFMSLWSR